MPQTAPQVARLPCQRAERNGWRSSRPYVGSKSPLWAVKSSIRGAPLRQMTRKGRMTTRKHIDTLSLIAAHGQADERPARRARTRFRVHMPSSQGVTAQTRHSRPPVGGWRKLALPESAHGGTSCRRIYTATRVSSAQMPGKLKRPITHNPLFDGSHANWVYWSVGRLVWRLQLAADCLHVAVSS